MHYGYEILPILLLASLGGLFLWLSRQGGRKLGPEPRCTACGYIVHGLPGSICPECGADLRAAGAVTAGGRLPPSRFARVGGWSIFCLLTLPGGGGILWWDFVMPFLPQQIHAMDVSTLGQPQSGAYHSIIIRREVYAHGHSGDVAPAWQKVTLELTPNTGPTSKMYVDLPSLHYRDVADSKEPINSPPLDERALVAWMQKAQIKGDSSQALACPTACVGRRSRDVTFPLVHAYFPMMTKPLTRRDFLRFGAAVLGSTPLWADPLHVPPPHWQPWPFYVMDTGLVGPDVPTLEEKVSLAKELGFSGIDYTFDRAKLPRMIELLDKAKLELTALYTSPLIEVPLDAGLAEAIKLLKGRPTRIEMALRSRNLKSSDPAGDKRALELIDRVSDLCGDSGPVVSIYPHTGLWTQSVEDGVRLSKASGRRTVGVNFNLVHWKWVKQDRPQKQSLKDALPYLFLVSINGLAGNTIGPLDQGNYDLPGFLRRLKSIGYRGPVGLQGYGIKGPSREHLTKSMKKWREMIQTLRNA
ncbi:MAG TPA: TIM barrel protein [Tepidisphaeraceae bacterium]|nr:TIM barrel protein [Tepidisphaeraceae bacterium]